MHMLLHLAALAVTILILARVVPSVHIRSVGAAIGVAVVFSIINFLVGWLIGWIFTAVLFIPALFTLGLLFVIIPFLVNVAVLWLTDKLMGSFEITRLGGLLVSAGAITLVNAFFHVHSHLDAYSVHGHTHWI
jgi:putative membrane protein